MDEKPRMTWREKEEGRNENLGEKACLNTLPQSGIYPRKARASLGGLSGDILQNAHAS